MKGIIISRGTRKVVVIVVVVKVMANYNGDVVDYIIPVDCHVETLHFPFIQFEFGSKIKIVAITATTRHYGLMIYICTTS